MTRIQKISTSDIFFWCAREDLVTSFCCAKAPQNSRPRLAHPYLLCKQGTLGLRLSSPLRCYKTIKPECYRIQIFCLVRERGLEPPHPYGHTHLKGACLPVSTLAHIHRHGHIMHKTKQQNKTNF